MPLAARRAACALLVLAAASALSACGSDRGAQEPPPVPRPTAAVQDFPDAAGQTLGELQARLPEGPFLAPAVSVLDTGENRFGFALTDPSRQQINGAQVAVYTASPSGKDVRGPFVARSESLAVKGAFASRTTTQDPDAAKTIYVVDLPVRRTGRMALFALVRLDGRLMATPGTVLQAGTKAGRAVPDVGDRAISIETPTTASASGDEESIDTRVPTAPELHRESFADVVGRKPAVLVFATPQLCQSRVCGPVVDIALQARSRAGGDVAFIHQEVFRDNDVAMGIRPQLTAWHLRTEPWTFVVDRTGRIAARFEGAFSPGELERAVAKVR